MRLVLAVILFLAMPVMARPFGCATRVAAEIFSPDADVVRAYASLLHEVGRASLTFDDLVELKKHPFHLPSSTVQSERALIQQALDTLDCVVSGRPDSRDEILTHLREILDDETAFRRGEDHATRKADLELQNRLKWGWLIPSPLELTGIKLSPNGRYIVAVSSRGAWGIDSRKGTMHFLDPGLSFTPHYSSISFSANSRSVFLSGPAHPLSEFDTEDGWRLVRSLDPSDIGVATRGNQFPPSRANAIALREGNRENPLLATAGEGGIRLFEKGEIRIIGDKPRFFQRWFTSAPFPDLTNRFAADIALSPNGDLAAYLAGSWGISLINTTTRKRTRPLPIPPSHADRILFSPDGRSLVTAGSGTLNIWNLANQTLISTSNTQGFIQAITFLSNDIVVIVDEREQALQYSMNDGSFVGSLNELGARIVTLDISPANEFHDARWAVVSRIKNRVDLIELSGR